MNPDSSASQTPTSRVFGTSPLKASASAIMSGHHGLQTSIENIADESNATTTVSSGNNNNSANLLPTNQNVAVLSAATKTTPTTTISIDKSLSQTPSDVKRPIRTLRPIDLSKLQQSGLDRKIAEILSKQNLSNYTKRLQHETKQVSNKSPSFNTQPKLYNVLKPIPTLASATTSACVTAPQGSTTASATPSHLSSFRTVTRPVATAPLSSSSSSSSSSASSSPVNGPKSVPNKPIIPPKITVTAPEACSENEKTILNDLTPDQRLKHVKSLLNKKLLRKQDKEGKRLFVHLKPPALCLQEPPKSSIKAQEIHQPQIKVEKNYFLTPPTADKVVRSSPVTLLNKLSNKPRILNTPGMLYSKSSGKIFVVKKEAMPNATGNSFYPFHADKQLSHTPSVNVRNPLYVDKQLPRTPPVDVKNPHQEHWETTPVNRLSTKPNTPQKSPQDIARKLDFQSEEYPRSAQYTRNTVTIATTPPTCNLSTRLVNDVLQNKVTNFAGIPNDSLKSPVTIAKQRMVIPDVSPLKTPFPTANVPQETPLPTIDTFKKPYPMPDSNYYTMMPQVQPQMVYTTIQPTNYQIPQNATVTTTHLQLPTPFMGHNDYNFQTISGNTMAPNSLIVLENKVLSQDEMIDLTALRLSKFDAPLRFARPHKPIVEIKQEKPDEPMLNTASTTSDARRSTPTFMDSTSTEQVDVTNDSSNDANLSNTQVPHRHLVMFSSKQNKKFIINAQKLKLPPHKIADLAKHIAEQTALERRHQDTRDGLNTTVIRPKAFRPTAQTFSYTKPIDNEDIKPSTTLRDGVVESSDIRNPSTLPLVGFKDISLSKKMASQQNLQSSQTNLSLKNQDNVSPQKIGTHFDKRQYILIVKDQQPSTSKNIITNPKYLTDTREQLNQYFKPLPHHGLNKTKEPFNIFQSLHKSNTVKNRQPAVEIKDEPVTEDSFSAVDFLASFACSNSITEDTQLELTPDELNLSASCSKNFSPLRIPTLPPRKRKISSSTSRQHRQVPILTSPSKNNSNQIGNIFSLSGENNAIINSEPINVNMSVIQPTRLAMLSSLSTPTPTPRPTPIPTPTPVPTGSIHDLLYNMAAGVTGIPKASIKPILSSQSANKSTDDNNAMINKELLNISGSLIKPPRVTGLACRPKASIKQVHKSTSSLDSIIVESSKGRDHVLLKFLDSKSPKKLDKVTIFRDNESFKADERLQLHSELDTSVEVNVVAEAATPIAEVPTSTERTSKFLLSKSSKDLPKQSEIHDDGSENLLVPLYVIKDRVKKGISNDRHLRKMCKDTLLDTKYIAGKDITDSYQKKRTSSESILKNTEDKGLPSSSEKKRTSSEPSAKKPSRKDMTDINHLKKISSEMISNDVTQTEPPNSKPVTKKSVETVQERETNSSKSNEIIMIEVQSKLSNYIAPKDVENSIEPTEMLMKELSAGRLGKLEQTEINLHLSKENDRRLTLNEGNYNPAITDKSLEMIKQSKITECKEQNAEPQISIVEVPESCSSLKSILKSTPAIEDNEMTVKESEMSKNPENAEQSNPHELNIVPPSASKRISRFKKGKINLVQRNKPSTAARQSENSTAKINDTNSKVVNPTIIEEPNKMSDKVILPASLPSTVSSFQTDNNTNTVETLPSLEREPSKSDILPTEKKQMDKSISITNDSFSVTQIVDETKRLETTPLADINMNDKDEELAVGTLNESENQLQLLSKTDQETHQPASEELIITEDISNSDFNLSNSGVTNLDKVNYVSSQVSLVTKDNENNNPEPEVSDQSEITADSLKISSMSKNIDLSNSDLNIKCTSSLDLEISDSGADNNRETKPEQHIKLTDEDVVVIMEPIKSAIDDTSLPQQRNEFLNSSKYIETSEIPQNKENYENISDLTEKFEKKTTDPKIAEQRTEIMESTKDDVTSGERHPTKICSSIRPQRNPKRDTKEKKSDDVAQEFQLNVSNMRRLSVSLVDIVKNPSPDLHATAPQIPFKRKRMDITSPNVAPETKGIKSLLNQIKGSKEDNAEKFSKIETGKVFSDRETRENGNQRANATLKKETSKKETKSHRDVAKQHKHDNSGDLITTEETPKGKDNQEYHITAKSKGGNETTKAPKSESKESENKRSKLESDHNKVSVTPNTTVCASIKGRRSTRLSLVGGSNLEVRETCTTLTKQRKSINSIDCIEGNDLKNFDRTTTSLNKSNDEEDIKTPQNQHKYTPTTTKRVKNLTRAPDTEDLAQSSSDNFKTSNTGNKSRSGTSSKCSEQNTIEKEIISNTSTVSEPLCSSRLSVNPSDKKDSCRDRSAQVPEDLKPRKKLRKTLEDIKKSHRTSDTDSDNDYDFDSMNGGCEAVDDFLGFEDTSLGSSKSKNYVGDGSSSEDNTTLKHGTTKGGTLKNWLTTGKAISPTSIKDNGIERIRHGDGKNTSVTRGKIPLKKRWGLPRKNIQDETDITDDTSPADDEEDEVAPVKKNRRNLKSVIDSSKLTRIKITAFEDNTATSHEFVTPMPVEPRTNVSGSILDTPVTSKRRLKRARRLISDDLEEPSVNSELFAKDVSKDKELAENTDISEISDSNGKLVPPDVGSKHSDQKALRTKKFKANVTKGLKTSLIEQRMDISIAENVVGKNMEEIEPIVKLSSTYARPKQMMNADNKDDIEKKTKIAKSVCKEQNLKTTLKIASIASLKRKLKIDEEELRAQAGDNAANKTLGSRNLDKLDSTKANKTSKRKSQTEKSIPDSKVVTTSFPQCCDEPKPSTVKSADKVLAAPNTSRGPKPSIVKPGDKVLAAPNTSRGPKPSIVKPGDKVLAAPNTSRGPKPSIVKPGDKVLAAPNTTRGRPKKVQIKNLKEEPIIPQKSDETKTPATEVLSTTTSGVKRKGRPISIANSENIFNPRLLLIVKREQLNTDEQLIEAKAGTGNIQCGLCMKRTVQSKWRLHLAEHYGIGWKQGEEKLNVNSRSTVLGSIIAFLRDSEITTLNCRMCNKSYRSGLGILSHIEGCGAEPQRRNCPYCQKDYTVLSLPIHIRTCPVKIKPLTAVPDKNIETPTEKVFSTTGRTKRVSTIKAERRLKQIGEELVKTVEEINFNPKLHINYSAPLNDVLREQLSKDIAKSGNGVCPAQSCQFSSDTVDTLLQHLKECKLTKKPGFYCNFCERLRCFETETDAIKHVVEYHPPGKDFSDDSDCNIKTDDDQSSNDDDDEVSEDIDDDETAQLERSKCNRSKPKKKKKKPKQPPNQSTTQIILRKKIFDRRAYDISPTVKKKWKSFIKKNFTSSILYDNSKSQYSVLKTQQYLKYLPPQDVSMKFSFKKTASLPSEIGLPENDIEWTQIERFSSVNFQNEVFLFLGAPITYCAWLPLPAHAEDQYLLVAYRKDSFKFVKFLNPKHVKTTILLFKVTRPEKGCKIPQIRLHYGFTIDDGPVYNFAFLPSGGYSSNDNRLGLVAVASVLPSIKIYSLPIEIPKHCDADSNIPLIQLTPSFELCLDIESVEEATKHTLMNPQCLQVAWSEFSGHNHIFAGFSNGFIGIWDITDDLQENLNCFEVGKCMSYVPLNYFYVGEKGIRCFAVHYDTTGPRWIAVVCFYRRLVVYDIANMMEPLALKEDYNRNIMRCIEWCPIWEPFLAGYCDSIPNNGRCIQCINPSNVMYAQQKMENFASAVTSVHYTPFLNMCVSSVDNGDVLFMDTRELHYEYVLDRKFGERRILSSMDIKKLDGKPITKLIGQPIKNKQSFNIEQKLEEEWLLYDPDFKEKYGLVFQPVIKLNESLKPLFLSEQRRAPLNMVPYMRVNTLRCNLNANAKRLIAVGHENGFLRVIYFDKDSQFKKS